MTNMNMTSLSDTWTPEARRLWRTIPSDKQELLLHNVHCSQCHAVVTMVDFSGREEQGDLILSGVCATCGGNVARVIETGDPMSPHPAPITLRRTISTVRLELDLDDLWIVLETLVQHGRPDMVHDYLVQLYAEEFFDAAEVTALAEYYDIEPPSLS